MPPPGNQYLESRGAWVPELGYVLHLKPERLKELEADLWSGSVCSEAVPKVPELVRRKPLLCLVSAKRGWITALARADVRYPAQTGWHRLELWNLTPLQAPVRISAINKELSGRQAGRARATLKSGGHISAKTFVEVLAALKRADPKAFDVAQGLISRDPPPLDAGGTAAQINWGFQRDAAVTALEIAGINKDWLEVGPQLDPAAKADIVSIFDDVGDVRSIEDNLVLRDLDAGSADWTYVKSQKYPAKVFTNGDTTLTIILANKQDLEEQLGVDLIYVNERFASVVFVQYKMFDGEDGEKGYRPNEQLEKEIRRMDVAAATLAKIASDESCDGFRLGPDPFFLKFCSRLLTHNSEGHVPGCYIPVSYWKRLVDDPGVKGPRGGTVVYRHTLGRYFSPTSFTDMVAKGWIGTSALESSVVVPFLADALRGKKGIVLAIETSAPPGDDTEEDSPPKRRPPPKSQHPGKKAPTIQIKLRDPAWAVNTRCGRRRRRVRLQ